MEDFNTLEMLNEVFAARDLFLNFAEKKSLNHFEKSNLQFRLAIALLINVVLEITENTKEAYEKVIAYITDSILKAREFEFLQNQESCECKACKMIH